MISKYLKILALLLLMISLTCCAQLTDDFPDIGVPKNEINSRIHLTVEGVENAKVENNRPLAVDVEVITSDSVAFSQDYGVRFFVYVDDTWVEIENAMSYAESLPETVIIPDDGGIFKTGTAFFIPYYRDLKKSTPLRIVLVGNLVQEGIVSEDKTAGYVDGILNP